MAIAKVNNALKMYYTSLGFETRYTKNKGLFHNYCIENGFVDDDIKQEIDYGPNDCTFVDMDMDKDDNNLFPFPNSYKSFNDDDEQNREIYDIIKHCFEKGKPPDLTQPKVKEFNINTFDINVKPAIAKEWTDKYIKDLPILGPKFNIDHNLMEWLLIGITNDIPLLSLIVDSYYADKIKHFLNLNYTVADWWAEPNNQFRIDIQKKMSRAKAKALLDSLKTYCYIMNNELQFQPICKIDDNVQDIAEYILVIPSYIQAIMQKGTYTPFQLDLLIAVKCKIHVKHDDDDDHKDLYDMFNTDHIGNVKDRLTNFFHKEYGKISKNDFVDNAARYLDDYKKAINDKDKDNDNDIKSNPTFTRFPHQRRFCVFVDRRDGASFNDLIMFQPPCNKVCNFNEWYYESICQCLIPRKDNMNSTNIDDIKKEFKEIDNITASSSIGGQLITFSFHVIQSNVIKFYINYNTQIMRFHGEYFRTILPKLFVDTDVNKKFTGINHNIDQDDKDNFEKIEKQIKDFSKNIQDRSFKQFYQQYGTTTK